jgi:hypothetical protein
MVSSVVCLSGSAILFSRYLEKGKIMEKFIEYKLCVLSFSNIFPDTFLIPRRIQ